ncbi:MAG: hypothetical protein J6V40_03065, partial [Clostridia bacterium]|nr:hypothetical protein [Clostridia bacterium]
MTRLMVIVLIDIVLISMYILLVKINIMSTYLLKAFSYELLLILVGMLGINNAILVRSKIIFTIGLFLV